MTSTMPIFKVLRLIRDARSTKHADRALLNALALRCDPRKKFACWPSYRQLALDTLLDEVTLQRAARRLEDAGLIKRTIRANRSNLFFLNIPKLIEQADSVKKAEARDADPCESPFEQPTLDDTEDDNNGDDNWYEGEE
jgi:hypothetical protein